MILDNVKNDFLLCRVQILHFWMILFPATSWNIWRHLKQRHVTTTCDGIRVSVQYRVSVPISCDICTLVTRFLSLSFYHSICIVTYKRIYLPEKWYRPRWILLFRVDKSLCLPKLKSITVLFYGFHLLMFIVYFHFVTTELCLTEGVSQLKQLFSKID